jgi:hypothetical protein
VQKDAEQACTSSMHPKEHSIGATEHTCIPRQTVQISMEQPRKSAVQAQNPSVEQAKKKLHKTQGNCLTKIKAVMHRIQDNGHAT